MNLLAHLVLSTSLLGPACALAEVVNFDGGKVVAVVTFTQGPSSAAKRESIARIELRETGGARKVNLGATPKVDLTMSKGMGQPHGPGGPIDVVAGPARNVYDVRGIYFTMAGPWEMKITLAFEDGAAEMASTTINVP